MAPEISERGRVMPDSPIRKLMPLADEVRQRGRHVYHLNIGQPDIETPRALRDRLARIDDRVLEYSPSCGTAEYLATVQSYYSGLGIELGLDEIVGTSGGSEAILFALMACADPGNDVLVVEPFYTNYSVFAEMAGLRVVPVTSRGRDGFHLPERPVWERALTPSTRAVIICNPNNPTGTVYETEEMVRAAQFCRDHDLFLIADEVYREFVYDGRKTRSALTLDHDEEFVIVVDSLSKRYSACGIRLGSLITRNSSIYDAVRRMAQGRLSPPGLAQMIATGVNDLEPDYSRHVVEEYQRRRDVMFDGLSRIPGVFLTKPEGAFYFIARLPVPDAEDFARWMLTDFHLDGATVMLAPASGFYSTPGLGQAEVRIAYVLREEELRKSIDIIAGALTQYCADRGYDREPAPIPRRKGPDFGLPAES